MVWFIFVIVRPTTQRGNFELDIEGDEIDDEDDDEGNLGVPASAIRPTGKNKFTSMFCLIRVDQKFCHIFSTFDRYIRYINSKLAVIHSFKPASLDF